MLRGKGGYLAVTLAAGAAAIALAGTGSAATICALDSAGCPGRIELDAEASVSPQTLPRRKPRLGVEISGRAGISTSTGLHPSALREAVFSWDREIAVDVEGLPACRYRQIAKRDSEGARQGCREALVGRGEAVVALSFPENRPIAIRTEIGLFNGGVRDGKTTLLIHGYIPRPVAGAGAIVARVKIGKAPVGKYGRLARVEIPRIAGGHGSLIELDLGMRRSFSVEGRKRSYLSATCPDGRLQIEMIEALFRNETQMPGVAQQTTLKGLLAISCTPTKVSTPKG